MTEARDRDSEHRRKRLFEHLSPLELAVLALCMTLFSGVGTIGTDWIYNPWRDRYTGSDAAVAERQVAAIEMTLADQVRATGKIEHELLDRLDAIQRELAEMRRTTEGRMMTHERWMRQHESEVDAHP